MLEDLSLPEAASSVVRPSLLRIEGTIQDDAMTPRLSARKTPKLGLLSTSASAGSVSAMTSPTLGAMAAHYTALKGTTGSKVEPKPSRGGKKRGNTSSSFISPAIRPKISPSIKPLLPEGGTYMSLDVMEHQQHMTISLPLVHQTMLRFQLG